MGGDAVGERRTWRRCLITSSVNLCCLRTQRPGANQLVTSDDEDQGSAWPVTVAEAASLTRRSDGERVVRFVLLGDAGSGKSTFLRQLALCLAGERLRNAHDGAESKVGLAALEGWLLGAYTPIYIELRDLVDQRFPKLPEEPGEQLYLPDAADFAAYVQEHILKQDLKDFWSGLDQLCEVGEAVLLLDGLDEVGQADSDERRQQIHCLVQALCSAYPRLHIIVASRPYAYAETGAWALPGFGHTQLTPLSREQLATLAQKLLAQVGPAGGSSRAGRTISCRTG